MKKIIICLTILFSINSYAGDLPLETLSGAEKAKLIEVLNQMEPEALDALLSDEGLAWYADQFTREVTSENMSADKVHGRIEHETNPYEDPNAPSF